MLYVGIDISKKTFDAGVLLKSAISNKQFSNEESSFKEFLAWTKSFNDRILFCMEATGIYSLALAKYLCKHKHQVIVVNPLKTHAFFKMELSRNKTDKADAGAIAKYCKFLDDNNQVEKNLFQPKSKNFETLQFLVTRLEQLTKVKTQENNHLEAGVSTIVIKSVKRIVLLINKEIANVENDIQKLVDEDKQLKFNVELLVSINGIGKKTACAIIAYLGDISLFSNSKQVVSYAGLNPRIEQSGSSIDKTSLSKQGNKRLRKALYMPAISAKQYNPLMKKLYDRLLAKGKIKKVALCAVMRKLLVIAYGVLKSGKPFDPCHQ